MAPSHRSSSTSALKQGTLSFASVKRTGSGADAKAKSKGTPQRAIGAPAATVDVNTSPGSTSASDVDAAEVQRRQSARKRKLAEAERAAEAEASRARDGVENTLPVKRARLDMGDKRWNKAYGVAREKMGHIEPIHAAGQTKVHHILRVFDLSYEYGPCIGVTRLERWERAAALGLNPPQEIYDILTTREGIEDVKLVRNVFYEEV
ncbi:hypothetical protein FA95DRAFT_1564020 [Auriscalpium vulgare]|uniref:Uncharacterized protein n=1 Tax=Auriscalpium vulgare TaxID=40419 RepID=A0ACB8RFR9_9AGAM|nr:hypothetical protein FA95DRAFT_1564020 [Auriscalpium vulgare]